MKLDTVLTSSLSTAAPFGAPHGKGRAFRLRAHLIARVIVVLLSPRTFSGAAAWCLASVPMGPKWRFE
jgi:hypothetical protein